MAASRGSSGRRFATSLVLATVKRPSTDRMKRGHTFAGSPAQTMKIPADPVGRLFQVFYDRRELAEVRRDIAQWLAKWQGKYAKLCAWVEHNIEETLTSYGAGGLAGC